MLPVHGKAQTAKDAQKGDSPRIALGYVFSVCYRNTMTHFQPWEFRMKTILVAGGGTMGRGIELCAAQHGFETIIRLCRAEAGNQRIASMERTLASAVKKNKES